MGEEPTRQSLPAILKELHTTLDEDWGDYRFAVLSTEDDAVVVRFELDSVESERGLHAYMNVMARSGDVVMKYDLKKVVEDWHSRLGDGYLYYMLDRHGLGRVPQTHSLHYILKNGASLRHWLRLLPQSIQS